MRQARVSYSAHTRAVLSLALPLVGSHVAQIAIHMTDMLMLGRYDVAALAAGTLATTAFFVIFIVGSGFAFAVMPMVAEATGRGDDLAARRATRMGLWASVGYGALLTPPLLAGEPLLRLLGQSAEIAEVGGVYLRVAAWGLIPALLVMVLKSHLAALERTRVVLLATVAAALVNVGLNYMLIFGRLGAPELGVRGAAIASVAVQVVSLAVLAIYATRALPGPRLFERLWRSDPQALRRVVRLGWPIGLTSLAETGLFAGSAVMMGWLGTVPLAAHGVAIQLGGLAFMVHLGLSQAATVRAGAALGRGDQPGLARGAIVAIALSMVAAIATALFFVAAPKPLVGLFIAGDEPQRDAILQAGATLLLMAAAFQIADAAQVMALGLLRGVQDTGVPMVIAALSYWGLGIPVGYVAGFPLGHGGVGVWAGLVSGLVLAAVLLMLRFWMQALPRATPAPPGLTGSSQA